MINSCLYHHHHVRETSWETERHLIWSVFFLVMSLKKQSVLMDLNPSMTFIRSLNLSRGSSRLFTLEILFHRREKMLDLCHTLLPLLFHTFLMSWVLINSTNEAEVMTDEDMRGLSQESEGGMRCIQQGILESQSISYSSIQVEEVMLRKATWEGCFCHQMFLISSFLAKDLSLEWHQGIQFLLLLKLHSFV